MYVAALQLLANRQRHFDSLNPDLITRLAIEQNWKGREQLPSGLEDLAAFLG